ncbi:MAG: ABC transporter permease, partial [Chloroflexota bacterium]
SSTTMTTYILRRLVLLAPTLLGISVLVFALMRFLPGDVVQMMIGTEITLSPEQKATLYKLVGLDAPIHIQFLRWLADLARGDLGVSLRTAQPVTAILIQRLPITAELAFLSVVCSWLIAIPLGVYSAVRRNSKADLGAHVVGLIGLALPNFWLATMLLLITSVILRWQPAPTWVSPFEDLSTNLQQMLMPVLSLSAALVAVVMRMMRSSMLEVLGQDYIRTARAKGLREQFVLARHALKNAAIPVITVMAVQIGFLLGGSVVIEQVFGMPGVGWMILNGIYQRDYPVVQGGVLFLACVFVFVNLVADVLYAYVDPRIRYD